VVLTGNPSVVLEGGKVEDEEAASSFFVGAEETIFLITLFPQVLILEEFDPEYLI
jgi:hypothetical protein